MAFSPPVYIHLDERAGRRIAPSYFDHVLESFRDAGNCPLDSLVTVLRSAASQLGQNNICLQLHIGEDAVEDVHEVRTFMEELKGLDAEAMRSVTVSVHTHEGSGHAVPHFLRSAGRLQELLWSGLLCADADLAETRDLHAAGGSGGSRPGQLELEQTEWLASSRGGQERPGAL